MYGFLICKQLCAKTKWQRERINVEPGNLKISFKTKENARLLYFTFNEWFHLSLLSASSGTGFPLSQQPHGCWHKSRGNLPGWGWEKGAQKIRPTDTLSKESKRKRKCTFALQPSSQISFSRWLHPIGKMAPGQPICRFVSHMPRKTCAGRSPSVHEYSISFGFNHMQFPSIYLIG